MLETERLTLRQMNMDDVNALAAVLGDPEAMRYYRAPFTRDKASPGSGSGTQKSASSRSAGTFAATCGTAGWPRKPASPAATTLGT